MASKTSTVAVEVIGPSEIEKGKRIVRNLHQEKILAVDSEGVQLGKDGPLTLLQVGTVAGIVYLFDVMDSSRGQQNKRLFKDIGLDEILQSSTVVKVIHSCSGDSSALYHQFGIHLENVFDTQVAHLVIEESKGRRLPTPLKLEEICEKYSGQAEVYAGKDSIKIKFAKEVGDFWAIRPLTDEMIGYASGDVTALIPEVYENQKRYLEENNLLQKYASRVREDIDLDIDSKAKERRKERVEETRKSILEDMTRKYRTGRQPRLAELTDEDELKALNSCRYEDEMSTEMKTLKIESLRQQLDELKDDLKAPETFCPGRGFFPTIRAYENCPDEKLKEEAKEVGKRVIEMLQIDIARKYKPTTELEMIYSVERDALFRIYPKSQTDPDFNKTVLALYWRLMEDDLSKKATKFREDPKENPIFDSYNRKLRFYTKAENIPYNLKMKATQLLQLIAEDDKKILDHEIPTKYSRQSNFEDLTEQEKRALQNLPPKAESSLHPVALHLFWEMKLADLKRTVASFHANPREFGMAEGHYRKLKFYISGRTVPAQVKALARSFMQALDRQYGKGVIPKLPNK